MATRAMTIAKGRKDVHAYPMGAVSMGDSACGQFQVRMAAKLENVTCVECLRRLVRSHTNEIKDILERLADLAE